MYIYLYIYEHILLCVPGPDRGRECLCAHLGSLSLSSLLSHVFSLLSPLLSPLSLCPLFPHFVLSLALSLSLFARAECVPRRTWTEYCHSSSTTARPPPLICLSMILRTTLLQIIAIVITTVIIVIRITTQLVDSGAPAAP